MDDKNLKKCTAFEGDRRVASGSLRKVAMKVKEIIDRDAKSMVLIFDDLTSEIVEVDFRGTVNDVLTKIEKPAPEAEAVTLPRGRGRPKLGVVSREVTMLPRHWDWLNSQPGGASVALRKLVEEARRVNSGRDQTRRSQEAAYRFMSAIAGDLPGFEEATRSLFAGDRKRLKDIVASWPPDIRDHTQELAEASFQQEDSA